MPSMNVQIKGLDKLIRAFGDSEGIVERMFKKALDKSVLTVEKESKPLTPIDKGFLRNSITTSVAVKSLSGVVSALAPYASYVHDGTKDWPVSAPPRNPNTVRQFFAKGLEKSERRIQGFFDRAAQDVVEQLAK